MYVAIGPLKYDFNFFLLREKHANMKLTLVFVSHV